MPFFCEAEFECSPGHWCTGLSKVGGCAVFVYSGLSAPGTAYSKWAGGYDTCIQRVELIQALSAVTL